MHACIHLYPICASVLALCDVVIKVFVLPCSVNRVLLREREEMRELFVWRGVFVLNIRVHWILYFCGAIVQGGGVIRDDEQTPGVQCVV